MSVRTTSAPISLAKTSPNMVPDIAWASPWHSLSHVFTIAGYATRGNPILGLAMDNDDRGDPTGQPILAADGRPYTTLGYMNGPGAVKAMPRPAPSDDPHERQQALVPTGDTFNNGDALAETHGGEDVALYATGSGAERAHGVIEQNNIFDIIMHALGL